MPHVRLVVAEKPSVARDLAAIIDPGAARRGGYLEGKTHHWTWALGHLVELAPPETHEPALKGRWRIELLPVIPERFPLQPRDGRQEQLEVIRGLLRQAESVVVATDAGREGELIWAYIRDLVGYHGPVERLWLSETTPSAVRAAFSGLQAPRSELEAAARARAEADWIVGMNATMALSARHGGLWSAGRVQTPTLALLVAREVEIRAFRPEAYHVVLATFEVAGGRRYRGQWFRDAVDRIATATQAERIVALVRGEVGRVEGVERQQHREAPPALYNLTDLQRAANARHGLTAATTLKAAQGLYETHRAITYPRTDARHVSQAVFATFAARLRAVRGDMAAIAARLIATVPHPGARVVDDTKVTDHHALLPTAHAVDAARLSEAERQVYDLVARRFVAALLPAAVYADTEVITAVAGERFRSRSRVLLTPGWREAEPASAGAKGKGLGGRARVRGAGASAESADPPDPVDEADADAGDLAALASDEQVRCVAARAEARKTKPPTRYSEGTLLRVMETAGRLVDDDALAEAMKERGLGTPATRAAIIETLIKRTYVARERRTLLPTPKGEALVGLAPAELREPATTGEWERRLGQVEQGRETAADFLAGISALARRIVGEVAAQERAVRPAAPVGPSLGTCPRCGGAVVEGQRGFGCANWRPEHGGCTWILWKTVAGKLLTAAQARDLLAHGRTRREIKGFKSRTGTLFAARLQLEPSTGRVKFVFDPGAARPVSPAVGGQRGAPGAPMARAGARAPGGTGTAAQPTRSTTTRRVADRAVPVPETPVRREASGGTRLPGLGLRRSVAHSGTDGVSPVSDGGVMTGGRRAARASEAPAAATVPVGDRRSAGKKGPARGMAPPG